MTNIRLAETEQPTLRPTPPTELFAGVGTVAGLTALISSSCCLVPLALAGLGATGAVFSGLEVLVSIRPYLLGGAGLTLLAGWLSVSRRLSASCSNDGTCAAPAASWRAIGFLALGSICVALAVIWEPAIEPALLRWMR